MVKEHLTLTCTRAFDSSLLSFIRLACMLSGFTNGIGVRPTPSQSLGRPCPCVCSLNDKFCANRQRVLGYSSSSSSTPTSIPSIVAEPDTTSVAFPAIGSQQRAPRTGRRAADDAPPSLSLSPPGADSDQSGDELPDQDEQDDDNDEDTFDLPSVRINGSGASASSARKPRAAAASSSSAASLLPPPSTTKVVKAPKGRVRVEKGFSQLDWAKLNRSGEVDLRVSSSSLRG